MPHVTVGLAHQRTLTTHWPRVPSIGQNLQPFTVDGVVSKWVKNSRLGRKNSKQTHTHTKFKRFFFNCLTKETRDLRAPLLTCETFINNIKGRVLKYAIISAWENASIFIWRRLNPLRPRMLWVKLKLAQCFLKTRWKCQNFFRQTDRKMKRQTYKQAEKLTWMFSSNEQRIVRGFYNFHA